MYDDILGPREEEIEFDPKPKNPKPKKKTYFKKSKKAGTKVSTLSNTKSKKDPWDAVQTDGESLSASSTSKSDTSDPDEIEDVCPYCGDILEDCDCKLWKTEKKKDANHKSLSGLEELLKF